MSFPLNSRRTAKVRALTANKLVEISKQRLVEAVREKPHYALILCRMLAGRLERGRGRNPKFLEL